MSRSLGQRNPRWSERGERHGRRSREGSGKSLREQRGYNFLSQSTLNPQQPVTPKPRRRLTSVFDSVKGRGSNGALRSQQLVTPKRAKADQQSTIHLCESGAMSSPARRRSPRRSKADHAAFFFATAFLATMTSGNCTTWGTGSVPF